MTSQQIKHSIEHNLSKYYGVSPKEAGSEQVYKAAVLAVRDMLLEKRKNFNREFRAAKKKRVYYICMEFLLGRSLKNSIYNLGIESEFNAAVAELGCTAEQLYESEPDAGLGNGGLGRLAACFMDALASGSYPAMGFSLRYEYGLFKQRIVDGWQTELPDVWLPGGEVWLVQRSDKVFDIKFDGHVREDWSENGLKVSHRDAKVVEAVGYDLIIPGYGGESVSVLRLWKPVAISSFDMESFSQGDYMQATQESAEAELLGKVLYPSDNHFEGKSLRLKQQYFLVSASVQNIIADHKKRYGSLDTLPDYCAIHINDTHPAMVVPELMRILIDENGYSWESAWDITVRSVSYTNHTVLSEALERWQADLIERRLPRIYNIIKEIDRRFTSALWERFPGRWDKIDGMAVLSGGQVKMASLAVIGSHTVNGVSKLHSDIIKQTVFSDYAQLQPEKFTNVTNGIAFRRWLCQANPLLTSLLKESIGDGFIADNSRITEFERFKDDAEILSKLHDIKRSNKERLANYLKKQTGVSIDPQSIFDVQAKRLHEYKRQLLNALKIISLYLELLDDPDKDIVPKTFLFAAKAAPGYYMAKQIIRLINFISADIARRPKLRSKLNVVFLENYSVSLAELLIPAADISQQISLAGKEASGTGNMKFMLNGALTLGTLDGANVEIFEQVGADNMFLFGMNAGQVEELWKKGYSSTCFYMKDGRLRRAVDYLVNGFDGQTFVDLNQYLLRGSGVADPYMCCADFTAYMDMQPKIDVKYTDTRSFQRSALINIANAGFFSADRSIKTYADEIWNLSPVDIKK